jgi:hypothetical protein
MGKKQGVASKPEKPDQWSIRSSGDWIVHDRMQSALRDYDQKIVSIEKVCGFDQLPYLVSDETGRKWWLAVDALNQAIHDGDADKVRRLFDNLIICLDKLSYEAWNAGQRPLDADIWETPLEDGRTLQIVRTWHERAYKPEKEEKTVSYTLEEIACLVASLPLLNTVKKRWPGATVEKTVASL